MRGRETFDTFRTVYRANSRRDLGRLAVEAGLELVYVHYEEGRPEDLRFNAVTYFFGMLYERAVNRLQLDAMKAVIYVRMSKSLV